VVRPGTRRRTEVPAGPELKEGFLLWEMTNPGAIRIVDDRGRERGENPGPGGADDGVH